MLKVEVSCCLSIIVRRYSLPDDIPPIGAFTMKVPLL